MGLDKVFDTKELHTFGITSSAFHIREHGSLWAKLRSAIKEINSLVPNVIYILHFMRALTYECYIYITLQRQRHRTRLTLAIARA